jgi:hypothetical protein
MQLGVRLSFSWDTFDIKRMIDNNMVHSGFLGYSVCVCCVYIYIYIEFPSIKF